MRLELLPVDSKEKDYGTKIISVKFSTRRDDLQSLVDTEFADIVKYWKYTTSNNDEMLFTLACKQPFQGKSNL